MPAVNEINRLMRVGLHGSFLAALHLFSTAGFVVIVFLLDWQARPYTQNIAVAITGVLTYGAVYYLMRHLGSSIMHIDRIWMAGAILVAAIALEGLMLYSMAPAGSPFQFFRTLSPELPQPVATHVLCMVFNLSAVRTMS